MFSDIIIPLKCVQILMLEAGGKEGDDGGGVNTWSIT